MDTFDVVVIGAGPGGYPAAIRAAQLGASVAIVEKEMAGGTCLNWGCIPTKTLISTAVLFDGIRRAGELGISVQGASVDYAAMIGRKDRVVTQLRGGVRQLLAANGVTLHSGAASFRDRNTVRVGEGTELRAGKVILATGSAPVMPAFLPRHQRVLDSRGFLGLTKLPETLLVAGGGYIGCELACMAALLGVRVTVVELLDDVLLALDEDVRREVRGHMEKSLKIRMLTGKGLERIEADERGVRGECGGERLEADILLAALGRKPVTEGLELERAGLETDERGCIPVDECCRTRVPGIYAAGDVTGRVQLAHAATSQGIIAAENAVGGGRRTLERIVPNVIFTVPEVGTAGLSETEAKQQGRPVRVGKFRFGGLGRAVASGESAGFVKWIADAETGQALGAMAVGAHATELISEAAVALRAELTLREIGRTIHAHPTFAELWMEAAHAAEGEAIHAPPKRPARVPSATSSAPPGA